MPILIEVNVLVENTNQEFQVLWILHAIVNYFQVLLEQLRELVRVGLRLRGLTNVSLLNM